MLRFQFRRRKTQWVAWLSVNHVCDTFWFSRLSVNHVCNMSWFSWLSVTSLARLGFHDSQWSTSVTWRPVYYSGISPLNTFWPQHYDISLLIRSFSLSHAFKKTHKVDTRILTLTNTHARTQAHTNNMHTRKQHAHKPKPAISHFQSRVRFF